MLLNFDLSNTFRCHMHHAQQWEEVIAITRTAPCDVILYSLSGYGEKQATSAFFNGEMEIELQDLGNLDFFGLLKRDGHRERVMEQIDSLRAKPLYSHSAEDCSDACKDRGGKAVICVIVLVFGTNQLNFSTIIYITRMHFCPQVVEGFG